MTSEPELILAFLFKRSGKTKLGFSEIYLTLSMDLNWFTPQDAKEFVKQAEKQKLLIKKDELYKPNFDLEEIKVPLGFYPSKKVINIKKEEKTTEPLEKKTLLDKIINKILEKTNQERKKVINKIKDLEKEKNITPEIAALLIGKEYNINFQEHLQDIKNKILTT